MHSGIWFWVLVFSIPIVSIVFRSIERINRDRVMARMAERGQSIPPEMLVERHVIDDRTNGLRGGIVAMFAGLGIAIMFWFMTGASGQVPGLTPLMPPQMSWLPAVGAIPFMIGLGLIVAHIFTGKR